MLLQERDAFGNFATGQMVHRPQQLGIFLPDDLVKLRGAHPGLNQLLEGFSGVYALMLPSIANEHNSILGAKLLEEVPHLFGAG